MQISRLRMALTKGSNAGLIFVWSRIESRALKSIGSYSNHIGKGEPEEGNGSIFIFYSFNSLTLVL